MEGNDWVLLGGAVMIGSLHLGAAAEALQGAVPKVIEFISGKEVSAL